jgi:hypothetical protein
MQNKKRNLLEKLYKEVIFEVLFPKKKLFVDVNLPKVPSRDFKPDKFKKSFRALFDYLKPYLDPKGQNYRIIVLDDKLGITDKKFSNPNALGKEIMTLLDSNKVLSMLSIYVSFEDNNKYYTDGIVLDKMEKTNNFVDPQSLIDEIKKSLSQEKDIKKFYVTSLTLVAKPRAGEIRTINKNKKDSQIQQQKYENPKGKDAVIEIEKILKD